MNGRLRFILFLCGLLFLAGCGDFDPSYGENFGNILATPGGLTLTQSEHTIGWGESNCLLCHQADNIHRVDRSGAGTLDVVEVQERVRTEGVSSCSTCHGTNGAP